MNTPSRPEVPAEALTPAHAPQGILCLFCGYRGQAATYGECPRCGDDEVLR